MDVLHKDQYNENGIDWTVEIVFDDCGDISYLGEYTDNPPWNDKVIIDRKYNRDMGRHEYRYFVAERGGESDQQWYREHGYSKHDSWLLPRQQAYQDYATAEAYNRGDWHYVGVVVTAYLDSRVIGRDSLWGIAYGLGGEKEYIEQITKELKAECIGQFPDVAKRMEKDAQSLKMLIERKGWAE